MKNKLPVRAVPLALAFSFVPHIDALAADAAMQLVDVVGRRSNGAYYATEASGAKSDLVLRELPLAVRVLSRQALDDLGAVRLDDALDYVGGVSRQNSFGGLWDNVAIRGLAGDVNNGMALLQNGFSANRGFNAARDSANLERLEFLKGSAAALYGASEPGGTINLVNKRPVWRAAHAADVYAGSNDFYRATVDTTGPLAPAAAYRLNAAIEKRGSFRDHLQSRRVLLAPALGIKAGAGTRIDYLAELLRNAGPLDRGVAAIGTVLGAVPRTRFLGEPNDGDMVIANQTHQLVLEQALGADWSARLGLAYKRGALDGFSTEPQPAVEADGRTLRRQRRYRDYRSDDLVTQAELRGTVRTGALAHQLLAGWETVRFDQDQRMLRINPSAAHPYAIDVLAPVYGQAQPVPRASTDTREEQRNRAVYLQDSIRLGEHWRVLAGVRHDRHQQHLANRLTGGAMAQAPSATSPRLGLSYLPDAQWTLFANAGQSFRPNNGADAAGRAFAPEQGDAVELGGKWESGDHGLGATLALYRIRKRNALTADAAHPGFSVAAGGVRSRGLDLDLSGRLDAAWRINASVSLIDARIERDATLEVGGRLLNIPRANASLLLVREGRLGNGTRYGIGGGASYTGARLGEVRTQAQATAMAAPFELPGYALAKLVAYWHIQPRLRISLDIDNLFDKTYYSNSVQRSWVSPGAARSAILGLQTTF